MQKTHRRFWVSLDATAEQQLKAIAAAYGINLNQRGARQRIVQRLLEDGYYRQIARNHSREKE